MRDIKVEVINTTEQIGDLVDRLVFRHAPPDPYLLTMYIDLEEVDLCREDSLSILTLMIDTKIPTRRVCLFDVDLLGVQAFNTAGVKQKTLKDMLQDDKIPKVFFDVCNDSDAFFTHFGVTLLGMEDVQLIESATRRTTGSRKFLSGLAKCVGRKCVHIAPWLRQIQPRFGQIQHKSKKLVSECLNHSMHTFYASHVC